VEILVYTRSQLRKQFIQNCAQYFANELKLQKSRYILVIHTTNLKKKESAYGLTGRIHDISNIVYMTLDSRLSQIRLIETIAHEMVHVKQFVKGQLKYVKARNGRLVETWLGKRVKCDYWKSPWEKEAYRREVELSRQLLELVKKMA
jgi:hypothetical protein